MEQKPTAMQEFIELFERAEQMGDAVDDSTWALLEEVGRRALKTNLSMKRPKDCKPTVWLNATKVLTYAAHTLHTRRGRYVLGFLPVIQEVSAGAIEKVTSTWDFASLSKAMCDKYEYKVDVKGICIEHSTLQNADAIEIQTLLDDLVHKKPPASMWHKPELMVCESPSFVIFYLPVIYHLGRDTDVSFDLDVIYSSLEKPRPVDEAIAQAFVESFQYHADADSAFEILKIGAQFDVIHEAQTERDLREIKTRMTMLHSAVTLRDNPQHEARVDIQLTWGAPRGATLDVYDIPSIRVTAQAKNIEDEAISVLIVGVHVDPRDPDKWVDIVRELMMFCFGIGWPNVMIRQFSRDDALTHWTYHQPQQYLI